MEKLFENEGIEAMGRWVDVKDRLFLEMRPAKEAAKIDGLLYEQIGPLALVPRILFWRSKEETVSGYFLEETARNFGVTREEIMALAKKNGEKMFPTGHISMSSMLLVSSFIDENPCAFGGSQIFYDGNFEYFKEILGSDYYIIPIGRYAMLLAPATEGITADYCLKKLKQVNQEVTDECARLGNFIFLYKDGKLSVAAEE